MVGADDRYDADYFLRGKESGKSLYEDYRWMPELTCAMAARIVCYLGIKRTDRVLDFGCARGYLVKALRQVGYNAYGRDVSRWAVENADPDAAPYINTDAGPFDWLIAKDVLEHVPYVASVVRDLMGTTLKGMLVVVPLSQFDHSPYVIGDYERDTTHIQRLTLASWARMFLRPEWSVTAAYRMPGIKDNWWRPGYEMGNGFILARRVVEREIL